MLQSCASETQPNAAEVDETTLLSDTISAEETEEVKAVVPVIDEDLEDWTTTVSEVEGIQIEHNNDNILVSSSLYYLKDLELKIETSITLMNEGPHCDLIDWVHGYTDWQKLPRLEASEDNMDVRYAFERSFDPSVKYPFPVVDMELIRQATAALCEDYWLGIIESVESPYDYPSAVGISAFIYKISGHNMNGEYDEWTIRIPNEMGC